MSQTTRCGVTTGSVNVPQNRVHAITDPRPQKINTTCRSYATRSADAHENKERTDTSEHRPPHANEMQHYGHACAPSSAPGRQTKRTAGAHANEELTPAEVPHVMWIEEHVSRRAIERGAGALHDVDGEVMHTVGLISNLRITTANGCGRRRVRGSDLDHGNQLVPRWLHRKSIALRITFRTVRCCLTESALTPYK